MDKQRILVTVKTYPLCLASMGRQCVRPDCGKMEAGFGSIRYHFGASTRKSSTTSTTGWSASSSATTPILDPNPTAR